MILKCKFDTPQLLYGIVLNIWNGILKTMWCLDIRKDNVVMNSDYMLEIEVLKKWIK